MYLTDAELVVHLTAYLAQFSEGQNPVVPLLTNDDGSINRSKALVLPCYANFQLEQ